MQHPVAIIHERALGDYLALSPRTVAAVKRRPDFPKPRDLTGTGRRRVWLRSELDGWLAGLPPAAKLAEPAQLIRGKAAALAAREQADAAAT
jgi:predicted DNA-binding transcriptional regulator AlpA